MKKPQAINLFLHNYKYFPYEKKFAIREVQSLLKPTNVKELKNKIIIAGSKNTEDIKKLVYFSHAQVKKALIPTKQFHLENGSENILRQKRQNTRYSVHGLHEYKGKFNPQVVRALFNIYGVRKGDNILDPFCGSGTTLIEAAHDKISAKGTDVNPLATFISNTKINALSITAAEITLSKKIFLKRYLIIKKKLSLNNNDLRIQYLKKWFPEETLKDIEALRLAASELSEFLKNIFLIIISNLLRDYSLQEPSDLRIRRRFSSFPHIDLIEQVRNSIDSFAISLKEFQTSFSVSKSSNRAINSDIKNSRIFKDFKNNNTFDFVITSPPYATALPYIDTQRLSLVWLNFITAKEIKILESELIGSREFKLKSEQQKWQLDLLANRQLLNKDVHSFCLELNSNLMITEGFRKKALPSLLYRYFCDMSLAFKEVYRLLKKEKYFCLIVGHNHTMIGGQRTDIDTPKFLTYIGKEAGFKIHEITELDAYQRYGLNSSNGVQRESLIVFKK